ncbi:MAG TPA: cytochrome P450 [Stellaceae bacterium]|nr:cytochrome P450 [Stellaceae bacterium]
MNEAAFLPVPAADNPRRPPSGFAVARVLRSNALDMFPPEAYRDEVVHRRSFGRDQITLSKPAAIHRVLVENPQNYGRTAATIRMLRPLLGNGLLLSDGEDWARQRHAHAPAFAPRTIPALSRHVAAATAAMVAELDRAGGQPVDLLAALQRVALDVAGRFMLSLEMHPWATDVRDLVTRYAEGPGRPRLLDFLLPLAVPSPRDLRRWGYRRRWRALVARIVAARRALAAAAQGDLFALLAAANAAEGGSEARLLDQVATMLLAGHETTAVALFWALTLVCDRPAIEERILAEAGGRDLGPDGAAASLAALPFTRAVVQETLRLYPPAFALARIARAADEADGIAVPRGAVVLIAPWVLHRHRLLWEDPERFDPARFLPGAPPPDRLHYMPFGSGPRVCIGAQFALTEATLVLARLLQTFHIERADRDPIVPVAIVTTQPDRHPPFLLRRRR